MIAASLARSTSILPTLARVGPSARTTSLVSASRAFSSTRPTDMKVLMVLYSGGQIAKDTPRLLGTTENALGLSEFLKEQGHELVVTDQKEGANNEFEKNIKDADIFITTPFHPGYLTRELLDTAKNLKICVTAGVGSDHYDLDAANEKKIGVYEVTGSNVVSVAEHVIMSMLLLVRNYNVGHEQITQNKSGGWNVSAIARDAYDLENKVIGTIGAGRIGYRVLQRLVPFQPKELLYYDYNALPDGAAKEVGVRRVEDLGEFLGQCDVVTVNAPLHDGTRNLINKDTIAKMKDGAWIVNTARGAIANAEDVAEAVNSGKLLGYAGDVWNKQPAPEDHPWRKMANPNGGGNGMVPHYSGTTLDAQSRYSEGVKDILERFFENEKQKQENIIVENGEYASKAYGQR